MKVVTSSWETGDSSMFELAFYTLVGSGFISSYAWTLMVVYYLQVIEQLPVLHRATRSDALVATEFDFQVRRR